MKKWCIMEFQEGAIKVQNDKKSILQLHIAVLLFSIAGVVGQFVEVPSVMVAMGRVVLGGIVILGVALYTSLQNNKKDE